MLQSTRPHARALSAGGRLSDLDPGRRARVVGTDDRLSPAVRRRLADLGVEEGAEITLLRRAPLGDPCVYRVRDYDLCLRAREAESVRCDLLPGT